MVYHGVGKVHHGIGKVYQGVGKVYHGVGKVYHGDGKVYHGVGKVEDDILHQDSKVGDKNDCWDNYRPKKYGALRTVHFSVHKKKIP